MNQPHRTPVLAVWFFAATLFVSAYLTFQVEPMIAKMVLPLLGGAPMVWNTCLVFFQVTLLAGYAYAHGVTRVLGLRGSMAAHAILIVGALIVLPLSLPAPPASGENPYLWIARTLTTTVGIPFLALTASSSLVQVWFASTNHPRARDPYFLYAASNLGSLLGLLLYPAVIERSLTIAEQSRFWTAGYVALGILAGACAMMTVRFAGDRNASLSSQPSDKLPINWPLRSRWLLLSLVPSSLLLGTTSYLTTDIASVPLLWVAPLSVYLLTFILAFGASSQTVGALAAETLPLIVTAGAVFMTPYAAPAMGVAVALHLALLATASLMCHGYLVRLRPGASHLTEFYLVIAMGGVLGGLFNVLVAPVVFSSVVEYPLMLVLACAAAALAPGAASQLKLGWRDAAWPLVVFALTIGTTLVLRRLSVENHWLIVALALPAVLSFSQAHRVVRFSLCIGAVLVAATATNAAYGQVLHQERTFFGVYRVSEDVTLGTRSLYSGTTLHGSQSLVAGREMDPLSYYSRTGPIGQVFAALPHLHAGHKIGVIGLGVGTLSAYAGTDQHWTFYEIDPAVHDVADRYFTFLRACGHRCSVIPGDARVSLATAAPGAYTLLLLDAFSSDAIPVHLLTREAVSLYLSRLTTDGILAFHISNRHMALAPVLARIASDLGLTALSHLQETPDESWVPGQAACEWLIAARDPRALQPLTDAGWRAPELHAGTPLWTDDFSNLLGAIR